MRLDVTVLAAVATLATAGCTTAHAEPATVEPLEPGVSVDRPAASEDVPDEDVPDEAVPVRTEEAVLTLVELPNGTTPVESTVEPVEVEAVQTVVTVPDGDIVVEPVPTLHDRSDPCPPCGRG